MSCLKRIDKDVRETEEGEKVNETTDSTRKRIFMGFGAFEWKDCKIFFPSE